MREGTYYRLQLEGAEVEGLRLSGATMPATSFNSTHWRGHVIREVDLSDSTWRDARLEGVRFEAILGERAGFQDAELTGVKFLDSYLPSLRMSGSLIDVAIKGSLLDGADIASTEGHLTLEAVKLRHGQIGGRGLALSLRDVDLRGSSLTPEPYIRACERVRLGPDEVDRRTAALLPADCIVVSP